jgi:hypothetical protein
VQTFGPRGRIPNHLPTIIGSSCESRANALPPLPKTRSTTIYRETGSWKWTTVATFLPIVISVLLCGVVAFNWRGLGG